MLNKVNLLLDRIYKAETYTIGKLYIDGVYFCDTLEDKVRDLNKDGDLDDIGEGKIYGESAIGYGIYEVILTMSAHFKRLLPLLLKVKGFEGVRIHAGNKTEDTLGCILVGINSAKGKLTVSRVHEDKLITILKKYKHITLEIK